MSGRSRHWVSYGHNTSLRQNKTERSIFGSSIGCWYKSRGQRVNVWLENAAWGLMLVSVFPGGGGLAGWSLNTEHGVTHRLVGSQEPVFTAEQVLACPGGLGYRLVCAWQGNSVECVWMISHWWKPWRKHSKQCVVTPVQSYYQLRLVDNEASFSEC